MQTLPLMIAAAALAAVANLPPAAAQQQPVAADTAQNAANMAVGGAHYEWRYHYVGRHGRTEGDWVLVR